MTITATAPNTKEPVDYTVDLRQILDRYTNAKFNDTFEFNGLVCKIRPLNYKEFSQVSMQTFEEQRIFALVNNDKIDEDAKLKQFTETFNKIRDITLGMVISSVVSIQIDDTVVTDRNHIVEFLENTDKSFFKALQDHIEKQKKEFEVPPMEVRSSEEQIKEGAPEKFEVPIVFDQAHFFA
jgi:hypothetical protein